LVVDVLKGKLIIVAQVEGWALFHVYMHTRVGLAYPNVVWGQS